MKRVSALLIGAIALVTVSACAEGYGRHGADYSSSSARYYDGYYDGFYGQPTAGYWASDGHFYYRTAEGQPYVRDDSGHFRRDQNGDSYRPFHMRDMGDH